MSSGERGCASSHLTLWRHCSDLEAPLLILEDDVSFKAGAAGALAALVQLVERCLPPADRFVLLYLSAHVARWRDAAPSPRAQRVLSAAGGALREAAWAWQTHAYVVWPPAARLLAQERIHSPVDVYVSCFAEEKRIAALVADPPVAEQWNPYADGDVVHSSLETTPLASFA